MLKKLFDFVLDNYNNGFKRAERNDPNFKVINDDIPAEIEKIFPNRKDIFLMVLVVLAQRQSTLETQFLINI